MKKLSFFLFLEQLTKHDMNPYVSEAVDFESTGTVSQSDVPVLIKWHGNYILYKLNNSNNSNVN